MNDGFKALSDPTRRKIIELLKVKNMSAGEIAEHFNMTKPSISHHLSILKNADLISAERDGQQIIYELNITIFQNLIKWFLNFKKVGEKNE